mmetsp:Transcript_28612/g.48686  ORF Transcript_28612/g.48686 Transcript_28612/m.48686 type:complete len:86 (-) Transcript_28612:147-404(-)
MQIIVQVRQNKVATEKNPCSYAGMNIWITDISSEILEDDFAGLLGDETQQRIRRRALRRRLHRRGGDLNHHEYKVFEVDGPFGSW